MRGSAKSAGLFLAALMLSPGWVAAAAAQDPAPAAALAAIAASAEVREVAAWAIASRNARDLPFAIVDKRNARVLVFDRRGRLLGDAPALLGLARGDESVPGIGERRLATITPQERTTPAGRFEASLGRDLEQDVLWIDYDDALSLHRVIVGRASDRRHQRLTSGSSLDNRISYGCINVPAAFYDAVILPAFTGTVGIVYILPETKPLGEVFPIANRQASEDLIR